MQTHAQLIKSDEVFRRACEMARVQPTKRQYSKYDNKRGKAFQMKDNAIAALGPKETTNV